MREVAVLALAFGCYRASAPAPAPPVKPALPSHVRTAADPLGFLPSDAGVVAHFDTVQLRRSMRWARLEPMITTKIPRLDSFRTTCGFDPLSQVTSVTVGGRLGAASEADGVVVIRGVARQQLMPCVHKALAATPSAATIVHEGARASGREVVLLRPDPGEEPVAFAFADARTLVIVGGEHARTAPHVRAILDGGAPLRGSDAFMDMYARLESSRAAWFVFAGTQLFDSLRALGHDVRATFGHVDLAAGATARLFARMGDPAGAANLVSMLQAQIGAAQAIVDRLEVFAEDDVVTVDLALTEDQVTMVAGVLLP